MRARLKGKLNLWKSKSLRGTKEKRLVEARLVRSQRRVQALEAEIAFLKQRTLTVNIEIEKDVKAWIQKNGIEIDHLLEKLIHDFYSSNQMIKGK